MVRDICDIIRNNRKLLKPHWSNTYFSVDDGRAGEFVGEICIFVHTKYKKATKEQIQKVARLFNSDDVLFIDGDGEDPSFWSIKLMEK